MAEAIVSCAVSINLDDILFNERSKELEPSELLLLAHSITSSITEVSPADSLYSSLLMLLSQID